jgi:hypothetical protein
MKKSKTPTWYRKKCVEIAKKIAKSRDNYTCQYCGKRGTGMQIHGSHILPEGAYPLMSAEPYNIIALCAEHHVGGSSSHMNRTLESWHSHPIKFSQWFNNTWPGRYKELVRLSEEKRNHVVNWKARYEEMKKLSTE